MFGLGFLPELYVGTALMFFGMGFLGMGNGSVFQLVPLRFNKEIGVITGIVGAAGGVGGFLLPTMLGYLKDQTGSFGSAFFAFGTMALVCAGALALVSRSWQGAFVGQGGKALTMPEPVPEPMAQSTATQAPVEASA